MLSEMSRVLMSFVLRLVRPKQARSATPMNAGVLAL